MIVDCAVYEDGRRRRGRARRSPTPARPARAENAFVWIGLHEPTEDEFDCGAARVRPARARRRGRDQGAPAPEARGVRRLAVRRPQDRTLRRRDARRSSSARSSSSSATASSSPSATARPSAPRRAPCGPRSGPTSSRCGPGAALYAIVDRIVDDYVPVIAALDSDVREVEARGLLAVTGATRPSASTASSARCSSSTPRVAPLVEPLDRLAQRAPRRRSTTSSRAYFRDVHDHLLRVVEQVRELPRSADERARRRTSRRSSVRQNEDVRKISAWAAIIAVPDDDRRHLRDELRAHAGARLEARLPAHARL